MIERISKELIESGIENRIITFGIQDDQLVAHIGDYWFYISSEYGLAEEDCSFEDLVSLTHEAVNDEPINADDDDEATECLYYQYYLKEQLGR